MSRTLKAFCLALCFVLLTPVLAVSSDLQASVSSWSGPTVNLAVHNPNSATETAHVRVSVRLDDNSISTLTSSTLTVSAGATTSVTLTASRPIVSIADNPEPY